MTWVIFLVLSSLFWLANGQGAADDGRVTCYAPNGVATTDPTVQPCINVQGVESMCCATNRTLVPGFYPDTCQQNGLCYNSYYNQTFRNFCTDKTWGTPNCLHSICTVNGKAGNSETSYTAVSTCADGTFCCGDNACCETGPTFHLAPTLVSFVAGGNASATEGNNASAATATATVTAPSSSTASATGVTGNGTNKAAIGLGVGLGVLAILGTLAGFWGGMVRGKQVARGNMSNAVNNMGNGGNYHDDKTSNYPFSPLSQRSEVGGQPVSELGANSYVK